MLLVIPLTSEQTDGILAQDTKNAQMCKQVFKKRKAQQLQSLL